MLLLISHHATNGFSASNQRATSSTSAPRAVARFLGDVVCCTCQSSRATISYATSLKPCDNLRLTYSSSNKRNTSALCSTNNNNNNNHGSDINTTPSPTQTLIDTIASNPTRSISFSILMTLCGAALGPFLDSYHSLYGVLTYDTPLVFPLGSYLTCVTTYWVPPLFGVAAFLIGWLYIGLDVVLEDSDQIQPSVSKVLIGISYFTFQYWLSGILFAHGVDRASILVLMSALAAGGFLALDGTLSGFITSAATAIGGPLIEVGLISTLPGSWAYHYNDAGETGFFPLWIVPVYFLGGPANGNLARSFWNALGKDDSAVSESSTMGVVVGDAELLPSIRTGIQCSVCQGTRAVPCPNCDDGTYRTYGQQVVCKGCRGKGRVICRSCFSEYGDDPNDIQGIRRLMDQMPD